MAASPTLPPLARPRFRTAGAGGGSEQYGPSRTDEAEARLTAVRVRLSSDEAAMVRYVVSEWSGEVGCRSSFGAMAERLAAQAPSSSGDEQTVYCPSGSTGIALDQMFLQEQWCNDRRDRYGRPSRQAERRADIGRAYLALCSMPRHHARVLYVLHGDTPPAMPAKALWEKAVDAEYRRLARMAPAYLALGGDLLDFERRIDRKRVSLLERASLLRAVGAECEAMIVAATRAYWAAL